MALLDKWLANVGIGFFSGLCLNTVFLYFIQMIAIVTLSSEPKFEGHFTIVSYITLPALWGDDPTGLGQRGGSSTAV